MKENQEERQVVDSFFVVGEDIAIEKSQSVKYMSQSTIIKIVRMGFVIAFIVTFGFLYNGFNNHVNAQSLREYNEQVSEVLKYSPEEISNIILTIKEKKVKDHERLNLLYWKIKYAQEAYKLSYEYKDEVERLETLKLEVDTHYDERIVEINRVYSQSVNKTSNIDFYSYDRQKISELLLLWSTLSKEGVYIPYESIVDYESNFNKYLINKLDLYNYLESHASDIKKTEVMFK